MSQAELHPEPERPAAARFARSLRSLALDRGTKTVSKFELFKILIYRCVYKGVPMLTYYTRVWIYLTVNYFLGS